MNRETLARLTALLAVLGLALSAYYYRPAAGDYELALADGFLLLGGLLLGAALWLSHERGHRHSGSERSASNNPQSTRLPGRVGWLVTAAGAACLFLMAEGNGPRGYMDFQTQFMLWCAGLALVTVGLSGLRPLARVSRLQPALPLLLITLLALALRVAALEDALHIFVDEMNFTEAVVRLWQPNADINILTQFGPITSFPWIYPYLQAISVNIFGANLAAIRVPSVIFGTLTIPALYLLARHLFDRKTALLAALLLATFPPHVHFSRLGLNNIADPFFGTLALGLLARALSTRRRADYALAGAALGLTQYFYEGGRLIFPVLALVTLAVLARRGRRHGLAFTRRGLALFGLAAALVAAPLYYTLFAWHANLTPRVESQQVAAGYWLNLLVAEDGAAQIQRYFREQFNPALLHYIHYPDSGQAFYGGETALILPWFVPAFLLGVLHLVWRHRAAGAVLLLWLLFTAFGNSLLRDPTWSARFVVALPGLALVMAVGIRWTLPLLFPRQTGRACRAAGVGIAVLIGLQVPYYFGPHLATFNHQIRPFKDGQDVAYRAASFPAGTYVFILGDELTYPPHVAILQDFWRLSLHVHFLHPIEFMRLDLRRLPRDGDYAFFIEEDDGETLQFLARHFTLQGPGYSPYNIPRDRQYVLYYVSRQGG